MARRSSENRDLAILAALARNRGELDAETLSRLLARLSPAKA
jgi:hypothetical protein